jgi:hypothetical protein
VYLTRANPPAPLLQTVAAKMGTSACPHRHLVVFINVLLMTDMSAHYCGRLRLWRKRMMLGPSTMRGGWSLLGGVSLELHVYLFDGRACAMSHVCKHTAQQSTSHNIASVMYMQHAHVHVSSLRFTHVRDVNAVECDAPVTTPAHDTLQGLI